MKEVTRKRRIISLREAVVDTFFGFLINTPINFLVIYISFQQEWTAFETSVVLTVLFTIIAVLRKTWIRIRFYQKYGG